MAAAPHRDHLRRRVPPLRDLSFDKPGRPVVLANEPRIVATGDDAPFGRQVDETIAAVERAAALLDTMREDVRARQRDAEGLKREIEAGQSEERRLRDRIDDLERLFATERKRTAEAESRSQQIIDDLERRIASVRAETKHLLETTTLLLAKEADADHRSAVVPQRDAAPSRSR